jgi:hypothetical protein
VTGKSAGHGPKPKKAALNKMKRTNCTMILAVWNFKSLSRMLLDSFSLVACSLSVLFSFPLSNLFCHQFPRQAQVDSFLYVMFLET